MTENFNSSQLPTASLQSRASAHSPDQLCEPSPSCTRHTGNTKNETETPQLSPWYYCQDWILVDVVDRGVSPDLERAHLYTSSCFHAVCSQPCSCNSSPPCSCDSDGCRGVWYPTAVCTHRYLTGKAQKIRQTTDFNTTFCQSQPLCAS